MFYALAQNKNGRKFVCIVSEVKGSTELMSEERQFVLENLPVGDEWLECVWDYTSEEMVGLLATHGIPEGEKAQKVLDYCLEDGFLSDDDDDDEE